MTLCNDLILEEGLKRLSIDIEEDAIDNLKKYKDILVRLNKEVNLTAITDEREVFIKHFLDSATCLSTGYIKKDYKIIDIGTGAGFPGLVLKILKNDIDITLLDSLRKRIVALERIAEELGLKNVKMIHGRAEEYGNIDDYREKFDIALSRAVASFNVLLEYCLPFVKVGGLFLCQKGPRYEEELQGSEKALNVLGGRIKEVMDFQLPYSDLRRYIIVVEKVNGTPTKYPRKPGKPSSNPII